MSETLDDAIAFYVRLVGRAISAEPDEARYILRLGSRWLDALEAIGKVEREAHGTAATTFSKGEAETLAYLEGVTSDQRLTNDALVEWLDAYPARIEDLFRARTALLDGHSTSSTHAYATPTTTSRHDAGYKRGTEEAPK